MIGSDLAEGGLIVHVRAREIAEDAEEPQYQHHNDAEQEQQGEYRMHCGILPGGEEYEM